MAVRREFFIVAASFAAPFVSDESTAYETAASPAEALESFAAHYTHPAGLYAADAYASADAYHKRRDPLAEWRSNKARAVRDAVAAHGAVSTDQLGEIADPKAGGVVA